MQYHLIKIVTVLASIMLLIGSCGPKQEYYFVTYTIANKSDHKIELLIFRDNIPVDTIVLPNYGSDTVFKSRQKGDATDPPPFLSASTRVTYDDSISIFHYRKEEQEVSRSILIEQSWSGPSIDGLDYTWEYLFTNDDYEEAVLLQ